MPLYPSRNVASMRPWFCLGMRYARPSPSMADGSSPRAVHCMRHDSTVAGSHSASLGVVLYAESATW